MNPVQNIFCVYECHILTNPLLGESKLEDSIFDLDSEIVDRTKCFVIDTTHVVSELNLDTTTQVDDDMLFGQVYGRTRRPQSEHDPTTPHDQVSEPSTESKE